MRHGAFYWPGSEQTAAISTASLPVALPALRRPLIPPSGLSPSAQVSCSSACCGAIPMTPVTASAQGKAHATALALQDQAVFPRKQYLRFTPDGDE
jgi:hypothetical protein